LVGFLFLNKLFVKIKCINCGRKSQNSICSSCINQIQKIPEIHCQVCKSISIEDNICLECLKRPPLFKKLVTVGIYNGLIKTLIYDYKYQSIKQYSKPLAYLLSEQIKKDLDSKKIDLITSIPLSKEKIKLRGFNQSELLAKEISNNLNKPYKEIFERVKNTKAQFSLSSEQRKDNLKDAFIVTYENIKDKNILIIDDIFTTGATIQEVSLLLMSYTNKIYVGTLARTIM
jgi:competence protein ComFC